jgi:hypothetical protein
MLKNSPKMIKTANSPPTCIEASADLIAIPLPEYYRRGTTGISARDVFSYERFGGREVREDRNRLRINRPTPTAVAVMPTFGIRLWKLIVASLPRNQRTTDSLRPVRPYLSNAQNAQ